MPHFCRSPAGHYHHWPAGYWIKSLLKWFRKELQQKQKECLWKPITLSTGLEIILVLTTILILWNILKNRPVSRRWISENKAAAAEGTGWCLSHHFFSNACCMENEVRGFIRLFFFMMHLEPYFHFLEQLYFKHISWRVQESCEGSLVIEFLSSKRQVNFRNSLWDTSQLLWPVFLILNFLIFSTYPE